MSSHHCRGIFAYSYLRNCSNSGTFGGFLISLWSLQKHLFWIQVRTVTRPLQTFLFLLSQSDHSDVVLLVCFESLSCRIIQLCLSFWSQTDGRIFTFRIFWFVEFMFPSTLGSQSGNEAAKQRHTNTWTPQCLTVDMMDLLVNAVLTSLQMWLDPYFPRNSIVDSSVLKILSQNFWGGPSRCFSGKCEMSLFVIFGR